ncbi:Rieske 2Fe-2S domain-containing protein [Paraburkholderia phenoliruptrix]|uniref:Rieske domain-containing protein n=1 Tax=Paraburkholderia phenoliruptrix TaxID=252970 RepID=A0A6J5K480_9BURK|nr:hypothetical protein LMG9964_02227 [Paraburkholderia phenoliruptrix]
MFRAILMFCHARQLQKNTRHETSNVYPDAWYVAASSHEVESETLFSRVIIGTRVTLYRKESGEVVALADRYCHGGAPLSLGRREGDCVRGMYHGLKFDSRGVCVEGPARERRKCT